MYGLAVFKEYDSQISALHLVNGRPSTNAAVLLNDLFDWIVHDMAYPLQSNTRAVGATAHLLEILREFHQPFLSCQRTAKLSGAAWPRPLERLVRPCLFLLFSGVMRSPTEHGASGPVTS